MITLLTNEKNHVTDDFPINISSAPVTRARSDAVFGLWPSLSASNQPPAMAVRTTARCDGFHIDLLSADKQIAIKQKTWVLQNPTMTNLEYDPRENIDR